MFKFNKLNYTSTQVLSTQVLSTEDFFDIYLHWNLCIIWLLVKIIKMIRESDIKEFQENGAVVLRNILSEGNGP